MLLELKYMAESLPLTHPKLFCVIDSGESTRYKLWVVPRVCWEGVGEISENQFKMNLGEIAVLFIGKHLM